MDFSVACNTSIRHGENLLCACDAEIQAIFRTLDNLDSVAPPSTAPLNFVMPLLYGATAALVSSSASVNSLLNDIHDRQANLQSGIIPKLFGHKGDWIDKGGFDSAGARLFINRAGGPAEIGAHRILFGHDIFSTSTDNPFGVLTRQHGLWKGVARVFQHLLADTFSKQGLPIPFHSHFDNSNSETITNGLLEFAGANARGSDLNKYEAFNRMFTIKAADVAGTGLAAALCFTHNSILNQDDKSAASLVRVIAYSTQFFARALVGIVKTGVPFISWPTAIMAIKEIYGMYRLNWSEIVALERKTVKILAEGIQIEALVFADGANLVSHNAADGLLAEFSAFDDRMDTMVDLFEGR